VANLKGILEVKNGKTAQLGMAELLKDRPVEEFKNLDWAKSELGEN